MHMSSPKETEQSKKIAALFEQNWIALAMECERIRFEAYRSAMVNGCKSCGILTLPSAMICKEYGRSCTFAGGWSYDIIVVCRPCGRKMGLVDTLYRGYP
jgi:hypothetical protein